MSCPVSPRGGAKAPLGIFPTGLCSACKFTYSLRIPSRPGQVDGPKVATLMRDPGFCTSNCSPKLDCPLSPEYLMKLLFLSILSPLPVVKTLLFPLRCYDSLTNNLSFTNFSFKLPYTGHQRILLRSWLFVTVFKIL